jgi:hypothetical protein
MFQIRAKPNWDDVQQLCKLIPSQDVFCASWQHWHALYMCVACRHIRVCPEMYISWKCSTSDKHAAFPREIGQKGKKQKKSGVALVVNFCYFAPPPPQENNFRTFFNFRKQVSFQCKTRFSQKYILTFVILLLLVWEVRTEN